MLSNLKARLLHLANSDPSCFYRTEFYAIKQRLLLKHAEHYGHAIQQITKECWGNWNSDSGCTHDKDCKCGGTGIYDRFWVVLEKYRWSIRPNHCYEFFVPAERTRIEPNPIPYSMIYGPIEHKVYHHAACNDAFILLCLLCGEWRLAWRHMRSVKLHCRGFYPLTNLGAVVFEAAMWWRHTAKPRIRRMKFWGNRTDELPF